MPIQNKDLLFAILRISTLVGGFIWVRATPSNVDHISIYKLLVFFALYSIVLYILLYNKPEWAPKLYKLFLLPDLVFLGLLTRFTGSYNSEFEDAYFLIITLHTYYYQSMRVGIYTAFVATLTYLVFNMEAMYSLYWVDLLLRVVFRFSVAICTGFLTIEITKAYTQLSASHVVLDQRLAQITSLYEVSQNLGTAETQVQVHKLVIDSSTELLQSPVVFLLRPGGRWLRIVDCIGFENDHLDGREVLITDGIIGGVFKNKETIIVPDASQYPDLSGLLINMTIKSVLMAPILAENRVLGVLGVGRDESDSFERKDIELLGLLASMAGSALLRTEGLESTKRMAITDQKTELYNYRYFATLLEEYIEHKTFETLAILMLDIDHFKDVNDIYGHQVGDEVLKRVAEAFSSGVRNPDVVARFGGEEFVAILPDCDLDEALQAAARIRIKLDKNPVVTSVGPIPVKVSFGVTTYKENESMEDLISRVDQALYQAKRTGRNKVCIA